MMVERAAAQELVPDEVLGPLNDVERRIAPSTLWARGDLRLLSYGPRASRWPYARALRLGRPLFLMRSVVDDEPL